MEAGVIEAAGQALAILADPARMGFLLLGVAIGLALGVIPGLSGIVGLTLLLPFTFDMDPYATLAFLMGLASVVATSDTIPSVLFGVPGTAGSAATIMDGYPMAKQGEAGRAFGAAFSASMLGGIAGAAFLGLSIPVIRPVILALGTPDMLAFCIFGLSIAAVLSGNAPLKGLAGGCLGLMIATTGDDPQTGQLRWTFDLLYLWDGISIVPIALGLFALPEIGDLVIQRRAIQGDAREASDRAPQREGIYDTLAHWWLVLRASLIGAGLGTVPGVGGAVIDWVAYGHATRTERGALETFGSGDVRGVIACEAANNAKDGGALIPTIAFGVPGTASMTLILGAFLIHGLVPGPDMLGKDLSVTFTLVWSVALANLVGAGLCFAFAHQLAKIALVRIGVLAPVVLAFVYIGAFHGSRQWGDFVTLLAFGVLGWTMKRLRWPRPPLMLGFVLGEVIERYMYISYQLYGWDWLARPVVLLMLAISLSGILRPVHKHWRARAQAGAVPTPGWQVGFRAEGMNASSLFALVIGLLFAAAMWNSAGWEFGAKMAPLVICGFGLAFILGHLAGALFVTAPGLETPRGFHYDNVTEFEGLTDGEVRMRAAQYFAWCLALVGLIWLAGFLLGLALFLLAWLRFQGGETWRSATTNTAAVVAFCYLVFHWFLTVPWPDSLLGDAIPWTRGVRWMAVF
jgi:TctA family transporter